MISNFAWIKLTEDKTSGFMKGFQLGSSKDYEILYGQVWEWEEFEMQAVALESYMESAEVCYGYRGLIG